MAPLPLSSAPSWCGASKVNQAFLAAADQTWDDPDVSEQHIQQALAQPDVELEVLVSAYRYYFYKGNVSMTLGIALIVGDRIRQIEKWPKDWKSLKPILQERLDDPSTRLYLSAYGASGLALARLGNTDHAQSIAQNIQQLGAREFGADVLLQVLNSPSEEDE